MVTTQLPGARDCDCSLPEAMTCIFRNLSAIVYFFNTSVGKTLKLAYCKRREQRSRAAFSGVEYEDYEKKLRYVFWGKLRLLLTYP